ncbi:MAG: tRNA (adenosine(37)-N6)-threonylcarbamoyltransferase complex ATPase subunit type 1 TsaE [Parasporobacterium sp.]|nr:tRNA (adenosine(37)-N6)-threonylcarbamoyltransferase complex ATPase subunit type 1 TsaE [Parasporobacterium sp.]
MIFESESEKDTYSLGYKLGSIASPGDVYSLDGDLGTGKTVFTAGFAKGLAINTPVCSPTFTILQVYEEGRLPLYHFDVYRIADSSEMDEIGFDEYAYGQGVCLIEWGSRIEDILPEKTIHVTITKDLDRGFDYRQIVIDDRE